MWRSEGGVQGAKQIIIRAARLARRQRWAQCPCRCSVQSVVRQHSCTSEMCVPRPLCAVPVEVRETRAAGRRISSRPLALRARAPGPGDVLRFARVPQP
eukprot:3893990-Prymnesium_polylepis.1